MKATISLTSDQGQLLDEKTVTLEVPAHDALEYAEVIPEVVSRWSGGAVIELTVHNHMVNPLRLPQISFHLDGELTEVWNGTVVVTRSPYHQLRLGDEYIEPGSSGRCRIKVALGNEVLPFQYSILVTPPEAPDAGMGEEPVIFSTTDVDLSQYQPLASLVPTGDSFYDVMALRETTSVWGEENTHIIPATTTPDRERGFRTTIKEGTSSNSDNGVGGTGFDFEFDPCQSAILFYRIRFEAGFDFVKGGKLPGLAGGDTPSGGESADDGFSARLMWRENGDGEVYLYTPDRENTYGDSIGRGHFQFTPGRWMTVQQQVVLNSFDDQGQPRKDGILRLWIDEQPVIELSSVIYRVNPQVMIGAIMYTIFFGGTGEEWRTPRDQYIDTSGFRVYTAL